MLDMPMVADDMAEGRTEALARGGDRSAWSELIARHNRRVVLALLGAGILPSQARDLAQEAWLRLIRQADARKIDVLTLPGLVIRQAFFIARSEQKRGGAGAAALVAALPAAVTVESVEGRYFALEQLKRAQVRLDELPKSARAVFGLLYADPHLSHAEIAARLGLSVQRVRQIICEVRKVLRADLEGAASDV